MKTKKDVISITEKQICKDVWSRIKKKISWQTVKVAGQTASSMSFPAVEEDAINPEVRIFGELIMNRIPGAFLRASCLKTRRQTMFQLEGACGCTTTHSFPVPLITECALISVRNLTLANVF